MSSNNMRLCIPDTLHHRRDMSAIRHVTEPCNHTHFAYVLSRLGIAGSLTSCFYASFFVLRPSEVGDASKATLPVRRFVLPMFPRGPSP